MPCWRGGVAYKTVCLGVHATHPPPPPLSVHRTWLPKDRLTPVGCIFLTHGVNEHIGRYCDVAHSLTKQGFAGTCCGLGRGCWLWLSSLSSGGRSPTLHLPHLHPCSVGP